jgi:hypothetical protein
MNPIIERTKSEQSWVQAEDSFSVIPSNRFPTISIYPSMTLPNSNLRSFSIFPTSLSIRISPAQTFLFIAIRESVEVLRSLLPIS